MQTLLDYFRDKKVLITGNTGFKGSWLTELLLQTGSQVVGYALAPGTSPALYQLLDHAQLLTQYLADIRDQARLEQVLQHEQPEIVFHLAGQALVSRGFNDPIATLEINAMGTAYLLQAARSVASIRAIVIATTDKVYASVDEERAYCEGDRLGGDDPYSVSKACAEMIAHCYSAGGMSNACLVATARAGNVLGGGDWAADRLVPDLIRAHYHAKQPISLRYPDAIRPWQHVLDPLTGYLQLARGLAEGNRAYAGAWNFAPTDSAAITVREIVNCLQTALGGQPPTLQGKREFLETPVLRLDATRSRRELGWHPRLSLTNTIDWTFRWYRDHYAGQSSKKLTSQQINDYILLNFREAELMQ
jgi:CDP-glucose 4,6-dehydratase